MNEYMVVVRFVSIFNNDFVSLIPEHRKVVEELMEKGVITSYSLSSDRKMLWVSIIASSVEAVERTIKLMPLYKYMHYEIYELMFHNHPTYSPIRMSMN